MAVQRLGIALKQALQKDEDMEPSDSRCEARATHWPRQVSGQSGGRKKFTGCHTEGVSQLLNVVERDVALLSLNLSDEGAMNAGLASQVFLAPAILSA